MAAGQPIPDGWPVVAVDAAVIAQPRRAAEELHQLWAAREPVAVVLTGDAERLRAPETSIAEPHALDPTFEFSRERLQYLVWSNNYDARTGTPIWWHGRRAMRLGAVEDRRADVTLRDGSSAWCDGGPRGVVDLDDGSVVVHRDSIQAGQLTPTRLARPKAQGLAPDQLDAVGHRSGAARIIAPAGSGKTRVLTARLRHLINDRGYERDAVTAVAYNKRAQDELSERTAGLGAHLRTINSLALAIVNGTGGFVLGSGRRPRQVIDERGVRRLLESLIDVRHARNTDPIAPYVEALTAIRLGLQDPSTVEAGFGRDAVGIAEAFPRYRRLLDDRGVVDFDEQIYAAIEVLLRDPRPRGGPASMPPSPRGRVPGPDAGPRPVGPTSVGAHLRRVRRRRRRPDHLLIRRRRSRIPHRLLVVLSRSVDHYALEVNYRCPPAVVLGVGHLLSHNQRRVPKTIRSGRTSAPGQQATGEGLVVKRSPTAKQAEAAVDQLRSWHDDDGAAWPTLAVLARVNSALLAVQVALAVESLPHHSVVDSSILERTGIRAALAYLRIGIDPGRIAPADVTATVGRPSRKVPRNVVTMLTNRKSTSIRDMRRLAKKLGGNDGDRLNVYADDLEVVVDAVKKHDTAAALAVIRDQIGLSSAMERLDQSRREADRSTHIDDLLALEQAARLHPDPGSFNAWLREMLDRPSHPDGIHLSTIHKVKGREWDRVVVFGANEGLFPHRLATEIEEERRVFHVAVTRAAMQAVVVTDTNAVSPFLAELLGEVAVRAPRPPTTTTAAPTPRKREARVVSPNADPGVLAALKEWRRTVAADIAKPAYTVLHDSHLEGIAAARPTSMAELARCPGVGPVKLDRWGEQILAVVNAGL